MQTLRWSQFSLAEDAFHVVGLSAGQTDEAGAHTHEGFAECVLMTEGRVRHLINGEEDDLRAGQLVMIRPDDRHDFRPVRGEGFTFRNVAFRLETLDFLRARYFEKQPDFWGGSAVCPTVLTLGEEGFKRMELRIARLMDRPRERIFIELFLLALLTDSPAYATPRVAPMPDWLEFACDAMRGPTKIAEGTAALYRLAGRSPEHVSRELKRCTGETPTGWVNRLRLEHAARHLLLSGEDITTLAYDSGFETLSYFSSCFKKRFGLTPRDYRKKHRIAVFGGR